MAVKKISETRYRDDPGRYYEDFEVGVTYEHRPGRTITEADNSWFTILTMNTHPLHFDQEYSKKSEFGKCAFGQRRSICLGKAKMKSILRS